MVENDCVDTHGCMWLAMTHHLRMMQHNQVLQRLHKRCVLLRSINTTPSVRETDVTLFHQRIDTLRHIILIHTPINT